MSHEDDRGNGYLARRRESDPEPLEDEGPEIQDLLDLGYEQLDGFVEWLESSQHIDTRSAQQDCFNAESYVDYLANHQRRSAAEADEFELRWFVFSHYIRKSIADRETQERMPQSLMRFYFYLQEAHSNRVPEWAPKVLEDEMYYLQRLRSMQALTAEDVSEWKTGFQEWCEDLEHDLDMRALWMPREMGEGMTWGDKMGWREATLHADANRLWQTERTELLRNGLSVDAVRERLTASYLIWLDTPQDRLDGSTPRDIISAERADARVYEEQEDDDSEE